MLKKLALALSSLLRRPRTPGRRAAPRFAVGLDARLLLTATAGGGARLVGATLNVSETGLAVVLPGSGHRSVGEGSRLHIRLELFPDGVVEMEGVVVRREECAEGDPSRGYVEYLGTRGWERAAAGDAAE